MKSLNILIIGGSGFVSGTLAERALAAGHAVWTVTRGQRPVPDGVISLVVDRSERDVFAETVGGVDVFWDLVVDCIGFETGRRRAGHRRLPRACPASGLRLHRFCLRTGRSPLPPGRGGCFSTGRLRRQQTPLRTGLHQQRLRRHGLDRGASLPHLRSRFVARLPALAWP